MLRKIVIWAIVLGLLFWVISDPDGAGNLGARIVGALKTGGTAIITAIGTFFTGVMNEFGI